MGCAPMSSAYQFLHRANAITAGDNAVLTHIDDLANHRVVEELN